MTDPRRLADEADAFDSALLRSADRDAPTDDARRAAAVALGLTPVLPTPPTTVATGASGALAKLALVTVVAGAIGTAIVMDRSSEPVSKPAQVVAPAIRTEVVEVPEPTPALVEPVVEVDPPQKTITPEPPRARKPAPVESKKVGLDEEVRMLDAARVAAPDRALVILAAYAKRFESGMLREEADALRVTTLHTAGRHDAAAAARVEFMKRYPKSSHAARLEALFE